MLLRNLQTIESVDTIDILIKDEKIAFVSSRESTNDTTLEFGNAIVFPGLINSHDHLDFSLFPKLGNKVYNNYVEWGEDIHKQNKGVIDSVLKIPKDLRIQWGIFKNLLNGITTVVNHGPQLPIANAPIDVWQQCNTLHSIQLERRWRLKLNMPFIKHRPFAIHVGEGTDQAAHDEINRLIKWNLLKRDLIGIHAIAMDEKQSAAFKALVWCPDSNYFLIGQTAKVDELKQHTKILFGTDSTVSASWNIWDHLRVAREQKMLTDTELIDALTTTPAKVWPMPCKGSITKDCDADLVIARKKNSNNIDSFFALNPEDILLVMHRGQISLFDEELSQQLHRRTKDYCKVQLNGRNKYVQGDIAGLIKSIKGYYPKAEFPVSC
jgi:cytosine/adenosine deaminase-related metal-dependent hydrolase